MPEVSLPAWHLGSELRNQRNLAKISATSMADWLHCSPGTLANYESGSTIARAPIVRSVCEYVDAPKELRNYLTNLSRQCTDVESDGIKEYYQAGIHPDLRCLTRAEQEYGVIQQWEPLYLPGLLQTEAYHRAICEAEGRMAPNEVDQMWKIKKQRQETHRSRKPRPATDLLLSPMSIKYLDAIPARDEQIALLRKTADEPSIEVRIVEGLNPGMRGSFFVMQPGDSKTAGPPFSYFESLHAANYVTKKGMVKVYSEAFSAMRDRSLPLNDWFDKYG